MVPEMRTINDSEWVKNTLRGNVYRTLASVFPEEPADKLLWLCQYIDDLCEDERRKMLEAMYPSIASKPLDDEVKEAITWTYEYLEESK